MSDYNFGISISGNEIYCCAVPYIFEEFNKLQIPISFYVTVIPFFNKKFNINIKSKNYLIYTNYYNDNHHFIDCNSKLLYYKPFLKKCSSHHNIKEQSLLIGLNMLGCERSLSIVLDKNKSAPFPIWHRFNSHSATFRIILSKNKNIKSQIETYFNLYKFELYNFFYFCSN